MTAEAAAMTLLESALAYARRGCRVFPLYGTNDGGCTCGARDRCPHPGKHPWSEGWQTHATADAAQIRRWWKNYPDMNLGVVTGATSGHFVLDVDGDDGEASLAALEREHGPLPETPTVLTGKGRHLEFQHPGTPVPNSVGTLGPGLDVRGDGGFVVGVGSRHRSGRTYVYEVTADPDMVGRAVAPPWLLECMRTGARARLPVDGTPLVLRDGERNQRLFQYGAALRRYGWSAEVIRGCLELVNGTHATPPLEHDEVARIAVSAARYIPGTPPAGAPAVATEPPALEASDEPRMFVRACTLTAPPVTWLVDGLVADAMLQVLSGKDKRGKTLLALEIGRAVLRGLPLFARFPTRVGPVMAALLDDPLTLTLARLDELGLRGPQDDFYMVDPTTVTDPVAVVDHVAREAALLKPALVILDALYLFLPGGNNAGNDAASMRPVMVRLDRLVTETGAAVLVIAHDNKGGTDVAGSYVIRAMAKAILRLTLPKEQDEPEPDEPTTDRRILTLESKLVASAAHLLELRGVGAWALLGDPKAVRADDLRSTVIRRLEDGLTGKADAIARAIGKRRELVEEILVALVRDGIAYKTPERTGSRGPAAWVYGAEKLRPEVQSGANGGDGVSAPESAADLELFGQKGNSVLPSSPSRSRKNALRARRCPLVTC
jgi:hypothetical protein